MGKSWHSGTGKGGARHAQIIGRGTNSRVARIDSKRRQLAICCLVVFKDKSEILVNLPYFTAQETPVVIRRSEGTHGDGERDAHCAGSEELRLAGEM